MKTSQNHKLHMLLAAGAISLAAFVAVPIAQAEDSTTTTAPTYKP